MNSSPEEGLFQLALAKPAEKRAAFLDVMCEGDAALRQRLEALLAAHEQPATELATARRDELHESQASPSRSQGLTELGPPRDAPDEAVGQTLGRYKLLERVGEGGCGVVYVAEQTEPVRRRIALKVIKLGMDTKQVVARFEAERQALAMMDHPNIAKVLDAGTTDVGRPFFVMELVRGIAITSYCDQANLSTKDRLDLFIKVCQAIQHAHQKGIIHRDIKPSNILVTLHDGVPVPKVIDFGIAKATEGRLTDNTVYTQLHQFIGTPAYMSPEQAEMSGLDIDTRSDIYSLGVLLYELLAGSTPFDAKELMASGIDAMRKTIREQEPVRPSTRFATLQGEDLTTTAKRRSADKAKLLHQLKGDLDWIVMKCLEKDRQRRYETANGLAADLKRHLNHEPVLARPPSTAYRFQKAFRRNKLMFSAAAAVGITLLIGITISTWQTSAARKAQRETESARTSERQQRLAAQAAQEAAELERGRADTQARRAVGSERHARRLLYAAEMNLVQQALNASNLGRARELLYRNVPGEGEEDLRGWEWRYFWQFTQSDELFTFLRLTDSIYKLSLSPDGGQLAVATVRGKVQVWDVAQGRKVRELATAEGTPAVVAFSPSGSLLAVQARPGTLELWDTSTWQPLITLDSPMLLRTIHFSRDGRRVVTLDSANVLHVYETTPPYQVRSLPASSRRANIHHGEAVFTPDGLRIVVGEVTGGVRVLDAGSLEILIESQHPAEGIQAVAVSPDGRYFATGSGYSSPLVHIWEVETGRMVQALAGHRGHVPMLVFSPDGRWLASASADQTVRLWHTVTWENVATFQGHTLEVWSIAFTPDGSRLITGSKDGEIKVWNPLARPRSSAMQTFADIPRGLHQAALSPDGRMLFHVNAAGEVARLPLQPGPAPGSMPGPWTQAISVILSDDGRQLAVGDQSGRIHAGPVDGARAWSLLGREGGPWLPIMFSEDGQRLVAAKPDTRIFAVLDVTTGRALNRWTLETATLPRVANRMGNLSVFLLPGPRLHLADAFTGSVLADFPVVGVTQVAVTLSHDGTQAAIGSEYGTTSLWNISDGTQAGFLKGHLRGVHSVAFLPDGRRLLTFSGDQEALKIWDLTTHQEVATLPGKGSLFGSARVSRDGNTIAAVPAFGRPLHVWRAPSWEEIAATEAKEKTEIKQP